MVVVVVVVVLYVAVIVLFCGSDGFRHDCCKHSSCHWIPGSVIRTISGGLGLALKIAAKTE